MIVLEYEEEIKVPTKSNPKFKLIGNIIQTMERGGLGYFKGKYSYNDLFDKLDDRSVEELNGLLKYYKKQLNG